MEKLSIAEEINSNIGFKYAQTAGFHENFEIEKDIFYEQDLSS